MTARIMAVRTAEPLDAPAIAGISAQEYDSWSSGDFLSTMNNPCARIWVCEESEEEILGYVVLYFDEYGAELMQIAVDQDRRREHIATRLMEAVDSFLKKKHIPQIMLEVRSANTAAREFYKHRGFADSHIRKGFYRNPPDDAVKMLRRM